MTPRPNYNAISKLKIIYSINVVLWTILFKRFDVIML